LPEGAKALRQVLRVGAAQILYLDVPDRAAVDLAVTQADSDPRNRRFAGLVNALLRRMAREKDLLLPEIAASTPDFPDWFESRLRSAYADDAAAILSILSEPPAIDLTVKSDADGWAARLGGVVLPTGSVRIGRPEGRFPGLKGSRMVTGGCRMRRPAFRRRCFPGLKASISSICAQRPVARRPSWRLQEHG
jgi:16S rRNA (cytosine967-C5)-methyltransferase